MCHSLQRLGEDVRHIVRCVHLQDVHHLALYLIANVVVAEVDVLPPLVVEILLSAVGSSSVVDVRELLGNHLFV